MSSFNFGLDLDVEFLFLIFSTFCNMIMMIMTTTLAPTFPGRILLMEINLTFAGARTRVFFYSSGTIIVQNFK